MKVETLWNILSKMDLDDEVFVATFFADNTTEICEIDDCCLNGGLQLNVRSIAKGCFNDEEEEDC